jgi:hypothetical protein
VAAVPNPKPILRLIHKNNLNIYLSRGKIHAPNYTPDDGLIYKEIHNIEIQSKRSITQIPCGPMGCIHDYVSFYFGYLSPMMLNLKTGRVPGYNEGQEPLIYLVSTIHEIRKAEVPFVFSDGHGIAIFTDWYDNFNSLSNVDWEVVYARYWKDNSDDPDRQRRKQAEFLLYQKVSWALIREIVVINDQIKSEIEFILNQYSSEFQCPVTTKEDWYYH